MKTSYYILTHDGSETRLRKVEFCKLFTEDDERTKRKEYKSFCCMDANQEFRSTHVYHVPMEQGTQERQHNVYLIKKQSEEIDWLITKEAVRRFKKWKFGHIACIIAAGIMYVGSVIAIGYLVKHNLHNQSNVMPIAQFLGTTIIVGNSVPLFRFGFKISSPNQKAQIIEQYKKEILGELNN